LEWIAAHTMSSLSSTLFAMSSDPSFIMFTSAADRIQKLFNRCDE